MLGRLGTRSLLAAALALASMDPEAALGQDVVISEFLASNQGGITDEDGEHSDWIEIQNLGSTSAALSGWYLTDDPASLDRWRFPARDLAPGAFLLVFASGKNRAGPSGELHTNFKLKAESGYLALVRPDGKTVAQEFAYPEQFADVSYGLEETSTSTTLVDAGAAGRVKVPADGGDGLHWIEAGFDDSSWSPATTGIGFAAGGDPGSSTNLARRGTATQSTTGFGGDPGRAIDGNTDGVFGDGSVTHTATGDPAPYWEVQLETLSLVERIVLWNRTDCCAARLSNFRVTVYTDAEDESYSEPFFEDGIGFPAPGKGFVITPPEATTGRFVRIELQGANSSGELYLSLAEVQVFGGPPSVEGLVATDLGAAMQGKNASAYLRLPFQAADPSAYRFLKLGMKYDDGFVAYLNGREAARRNAPASLGWDSAALAARPPGQGLLLEELDLSGPGLLQPGANLLAIQGLNLSRDDPDFLILPFLRGGSVETSASRYFTQPTPGKLNQATGVQGFVAGTGFGVDRGFFAAPFDVAITCDTPGAQIRYTLNGSPPTADTGFPYTGPVHIAATTTLRAAAFKDGFAPSNAGTQTYIFPAQVVKQNGSGFPPFWGGTAADYEMDPNVVNSPAYRDTIEKDIVTRIPSLSIVMKNEDLFGPQGIYSNTEARGDAWERPCSMELIYPGDAIAAPPDGKRGFQIDCGVRIYGYGWRPPSASMKHAFRLLFKRKYGAAKLDYPFFPDWPVKRFNDIVLRSQGSRSWNDFRPSIEQTCYMRDAWARYTEREMGKLTTSSTYVHLYLNGLYWGLYNPVERPDASFMSEHLGGAEEDYDALNARVGAIEVINGSRQAWDALMALARGDVSTLAAYQRIQETLDVVDLADYMLIEFYTVNQDWPGSNGNNMRVAGSPTLGIGFKSFTWDMEYSIWNAGDNVMSVLTQYDTPAALYARLKTNPEFRMLFADRAHRHLKNGGALTPERAGARWEELAAQIDRAVVGESARWGDRRREPPYTRDVEWVREQKRLLTTFFPQRTDLMLGQLRAAGLYPQVEAPIFSQEGGPILPGFTLTVEVPAGLVYYTLDGSDPRLPGGAVSPAALQPGEGAPLLLVVSGAAVRALVPADGSLGLAWTAVDFDDSAWLQGTTGVGYEAATGYEKLIGTDVLAQAYQVRASVYARVEFQVPDPAALGSLSLRMKYDDGFVAYLNGTYLASRNAPADPRWDSAATTFNDDARAVIFESIELPAAARVQTGKNVLALQGLNQSAVSNDLLILPELSASSAGGPGVVLDRTTTVRARAWLNGVWSALAEATFVVDSSGLRITELMYHPPPPAAGSPFQNDDFEFIEIQNTGGWPLNLAGVSLSGAVEFAFPENGPAGDLQPEGFVLVVKNLEAFRSRYPAADISIAGEYQGNLSNGGERIVLADAAGETILDFGYSDQWYPATDGGGYSLEVRDPRAPPASWQDAASWRASSVLGGTPGRGDLSGGRQIPGDLNQDGALDISDAVAVLTHLFLGSPAVLPCAGGKLSDPGNRRLLDANGDGAVDLTDTILLLNYLFLSGPPPALGLECVRIEGCPESCR